jgi:anti-sigma28 factor (negative regulator of flagellin synthesis)
MRITGPDHCQPVGALSRVDRTQAVEESAPQDVIVLGDRAVKLSDRIAADETQREQRLAEIKKQLDEGTYDIDLDLLAEKLVDEELAWSGDVK